MIQRKQTLMLVLSLVLTATLFFQEMGLFLTDSGLFELNFYSLTDVTNAVAPQVVYLLIPLTVLVVLVNVLNLISIFLFKNRPVQMRICGLNVGILLGLAGIIVYLNYAIAGDLETEWHFNSTVIIPLVAAFLNFFAYRAISDDEALIQSLNRLR